MQLAQNFGHAVRHYVAGFFAASWNGGIGAVAGILGNDVAALTGVPNVTVLNWQGMLSVFGGAFVLHGIFWLKAHPIPETFDTEAPFFPAPSNPPPQPPSVPSS